MLTADSENFRPEPPLLAFASRQFLEGSARADFALSSGSAGQNITRKPNCRLRAALLWPLSRMILPKFVEVGVRFGSEENTGVFNALNASNRNCVLIPSRI